MTLALALSLSGIGGLSMASASASSPVNSLHYVADFKDNACKGLAQVDESQGCGKGQAKVDSIVSTLVNALSIIIGSIAVIFIIFAGFKYITSGGDAAQVTSAKNALIYALVGLFIAAIAQFLVHVVFKAAEKV